MALHVLKQGTPTWGNVLGSSVGHGVSALAKTKLERMKENEDIKLYTNLGIDPIQARLIHRLPEEQRARTIAELLDQNREKQAESQTNYQEDQSTDQMLNSAREAQPQVEALGSVLGKKPPLSSQTAGGVSMDLLPEPLRKALEESLQKPGFPQQQKQQGPALEFKPESTAPAAVEKPADHSALANALRKGATKGGAKGSDQELKERKQTFLEQKSLAPFLEGERKDYAVNRQIARKAQEALDLLKQHHKDWPGAFKGNLSEDKKALLLRDPNVREYAAKIADLVILKGQSRKGVPSNFKLKLEEMAKANLNQPVKTQEHILESMIDDAKDSERKWSFINGQKKDGLFPLDLPSRAVDFDLASDDPLGHPDAYEEGTVYEEHGKKHILKNGKWVKE